MNIGSISTERKEPFCFFYVLLYLYYFLDPERKACSINYIFTIANSFYNLNHTKKTCQWYLTPTSVSCYICTIFLLLPLTTSKKVFYLLKCPVLQISSPEPRATQRIGNYQQFFFNQILPTVYQHLILSMHPMQ